MLTRIEQSRISEVQAKWLANGLDVYMHDDYMYFRAIYPFSTVNMLYKNSQAGRLFG